MENIGETLLQPQLAALEAAQVPARSFPLIRIPAFG
jgi:hypothetical protein